MGPSRSSSAVALISLWALAGCSRDLALPGAHAPLSAAAPAGTIAPREGYTVVPSGGMVPYAFAFAAGGKGSGPLASVDAATGAYVAGAVGPAIDTLLVTDAAGATATVRITVGAPLSVSPTTAVIAPRETLTLVATGGKGPYTFTDVSASTGALVENAFTAPGAASCAAAPVPPGSATIEVRDATGAPPILVDVEWTRGVDLYPAAGTGTVAPGETLALIASGGQQPYTFDLVQAQSGTPTVSPTRGVYTAGWVGTTIATTSVVDRVRVTDAFGEQRCLDLHLGKLLTLAAPSKWVRSGDTVQLLASGGRAPYQFAFASKGNRSRGRLDPYGGAYTAGVNVGAVDRLVLSDAVGAVAPAVSVNVLQPQYAIGDQPGGCAIGDFNGDRKGDLVATNRSSLPGPNWLLLSRIDGTRALSTYGGSYSLGRYAFDVNADGLADVVSFGGPGTCTGASVWAHPGTLGGGLGSGRLLYTGLCNAGIPYSVARQALAFGSPAQNRSRLLVPDWTAVCNPPGGSSGIAAIDWISGNPDPLPAACAFTTGGTVRELVAADVDGTGTADVVTADTGASVTFKVRHAQAAGTYDASDAATTTVQLAGWSLPAQGAAWRGVPFIFRVPSPLVAGRDAVVAVVVQGSGASQQTALVALYWNSSGTPALAATTPYVVHTGSLGPTLAAFGAGPSGVPVAALAGIGTEIRPYAFDGTTFAPLPSPSPRSFVPGCLAAGDLDGDGVIDLAVVAGDTSQQTEILLGEGDGTFGRRPRFFQGVPTSWRFTRASADVDGDGRTDVVAANWSGDLETLFSSDHQLAVSDATTATREIDRLAVGDFDGDGAPDVASADTAHQWVTWRGSAARDGTFESPQAVTLEDTSGATLTYAWLPWPLGATLAASAPSAGVVAGNFSASSNQAGALHFTGLTRAVQFTSATQSGAGDVAQPNLVAADLDGDGLTDVVLGTRGGAFARAYTRWSGSPAVPAFSALSTSTASGWSSAYYSGTGAVTAGAGRSQRAVFVGNASGWSMPPQVIVVGDAGYLNQSTVPAATWNAWASAVGDLTGDGLPDLAIQDTRGRLHVFPMKADGSCLFDLANDLGWDAANSRYRLVAPLAAAHYGFISGGNDLFVLTSPDGKGDLVVHTDDSYVVIPPAEILP